MKRTRFLFVTGAIAVLALSSCANPFHPSAAAKGTLTISIGSPARALKATRTIAPVADHYSILLHPASGVNGNVDINIPNVADLGSPVTLVVGNWTLTLSSLDSTGAALATGTATIMIQPGPNVVEIAMTPATSLTITGTGSLSATFYWPASYVTSATFSLHTYPTAGAELVGSAGVKTSYDSTNNMAIITAATIPSGTYFLSLNLMNGAALQASVGDIVQIYDNKLSSKTTQLTVADMTQATAPAAPFNLALQNSNGWHLTWGPGLDVIGYLVSVNGAANITVLAASGTSLSLGAPPAAGTVFSIVAYNRGGQSSAASLTYTGSENSITAFSFTSPAATATIQGTTIYIGVPAGTNLTALVATFTTDGASVAVGSTVQTSGGTPNDFTNNVTYTVTASNGSTQSYVVVAAPPPVVLGFSLLSPYVSGTINGTNIDVTVPYGTPVTALTPIYSMSPKAILFQPAPASAVQFSGFSAQAQDFSSPVVFNATTGVTAFDAGNTVTVTVQSQASSSDITSFGFASSLNTIISGTNILVLLPNATPVTNLAANFATNGGSVKVGGILQTSGNSYDFTNPVTFTVTSTDALTITNYKVRVATNSQIFNSTGAAQNFTVPAGVTSLFVDAEGAQGSNGGGSTAFGGNGGRVLGEIAVTPTESLSVNVGTRLGFNGGGTGTGVGGGASDIRRGANRLLVAGGGGGGGSGSGSANYPEGSGGVGGAYYGGDGFDGDAGGRGLGATLTSAGLGGPGAYGGAGGTPGTAGLGGNGGSGPNSVGGGGGGGLYGGGGGGSGYTGGGGGGGSSLVPSAGTSIPAYQAGDGQITLYW